MPTLEANGQTLHFDVDGPKGAPVLFFLHGFLMDGRMFDPQVDALSDRYRCVRFDARAFGRTAWDGEAFDLYDTLSDALALLDHLGVERATWVGYSQGGYVAMRAALKHPERVSALVLMSTRTGDDGDEGRAGMQELRDTWRAHGAIPPLLEGMAGVLLGAKERVPHLWAEWQPRWAQVSGEAFFHASNNLLQKDDITARLGEISVPTTVVHGYADQGIPPKHGQALYAAIPDTRGLLIVPGAAHAASLSHSNLVNAAVEAFLAEL